MNTYENINIALRITFIKSTHPDLVKSFIPCENVHIFLYAKTASMAKNCIVIFFN